MIGIGARWIIRCSISAASMRDRLTVLITNIAFTFRSGDEASDVLELALSRHTRKFRTEILQRLEDLGRRLCHTPQS